MESTVNHFGPLEIFCGYGPRVGVSKKDQITSHNDRTTSGVVVPTYIEGSTRTSVPVNKDGFGLQYYKRIVIIGNPSNDLFLQTLFSREERSQNGVQEVFLC